MKHLPDLLHDKVASSIIHEQARRWHDLSGSANCLMYYAGYLDDPLIAEMTKSIQGTLEGGDLDTGTRHRLGFVFVEIAQNIIRYSADPIIDGDVSEDPRTRFGWLWVGRLDGRYVVQGINRVNEERATILRSKLDYLHHLDRTELKKVYKQARKSDPPKESKGAGIGIYELALQTSGSFEYAIFPLSDGSSIFSISAYL